MTFGEGHGGPTRRRFLANLSGGGLGMTALGAMLAKDGLLSPNAALAGESPIGGVDMELNPLAARAPAFAPKAKRCIFLFHDGGPSQMDLYDPKPKLKELEGQRLPDSLLKNVRFAFIKKDAQLRGSPFKFKKYGQCGMDFSELLPKVATLADEICMVRSMVTDQFNHHPASLTLQCGTAKLGLPSMGSWVTYGLGNESENLPGYVVLTGGRGTSGAGTLWHNGFLSSAHAGVLFRTRGEPVLNLANPEGVSRELRREQLDVLRRLNESHFERANDPEIRARIAHHELAFRMQAAATDLGDLSGESAATLAAYGVDRADPKVKIKRDGGPGQYRDFATNCLLARRLVERGVRFVNIFHASWDHHEDVDGELPFYAAMADQPVAALIGDLKQRGLLDETLVVWASEFGRTPLAQGTAGRDHHPYAFTIFMAGGGVRPGYVHGETDEIGWAPVRDAVHVNDLQATLLHLFGLDHLKLTYKFKGVEQRLTTITRQARVVRELLA
jgi:uncharacterized protein (DUF1501 family)